MSKSDTPNILFLMVDQMKATASHLWGNRFCNTPGLEKLAQNGVLYSKAFTPIPLCVPARTALFSSQYPHCNGARHNNTYMPLGVRHSFQIWKEQGLTTGLIGKNHCFEHMEDRNLFDVWCEIFHWNIPNFAWFKGAKWHRPYEAIQKAHEVRSSMRVPSSQKFDNEMPCHRSTFAYAFTDYPIEDYGTSLIAEQTRRFLEQNRRNPFVLWVSFPDPHTPYEAPRKYFENFYPDRVEIPDRETDELETAPERTKVLFEMLRIDKEPEEHVRGVLSAYYGLVQFIDDAVQQIMQALSDCGLAENTIVVFCSDHGDFAGEHGMTQKGGVFYDCLVHVPLILSWQGAPWAGRTDSNLVSLLDVVPTLLKLQGIAIPPSMSGRLLPTAVDVPAREEVISEYGAGGPPFTMQDLQNREVTQGLIPLIETLKQREAEGLRKMVRTHSWKYVHDPLGDKDELYDLENDPGELSNICDEIRYKDVVAEMQRRLMDWSIQNESFVLNR